MTEIDLTPITRLEYDIDAILNDHAVAEPITRIELILADIVAGNTTTVEPVTRIETYLTIISGADYPVPEPVTRIETFLAIIAGEDYEEPEAVTRLEGLLAEWVEKGSGIWKTVTGTLLHITDALASPVKELSVAIEPLQSGSGDPSPDNVRPITGWTGCNIFRTGANICDFADAGIGTKSLYNLSSGTISIGGSGASISGTNPIEITNTTTWRGAVFFSKPMKSGQQCKIRYRITGTSPSNIKRTTYIVDGSNAIVSKVSSSASPDHDVDYVYTQNVTAVSDGDKAVFVVESATKQTITIYDLSFNYPSTDTSYHAYSGTTYPISWQTEAGTVYGGTVTINQDGSVDLTATFASYDIPSTKWSWRSASNIWYINRSSISPPYLNLASSNANFVGYCDKYKIVGYNQLSSSVNSIAVRTGDYNWLACFGAERSSEVRPEDCTIVLKLAEPIVYHLASVAQISTLTGENNIWADANGEITLTYQAVPESAFSDEADKGMADYMTLLS